MGVVTDPKKLPLLPDTIDNGDALGICGMDIAGKEDDPAMTSGFDNATPPNIEEDSDESEFSD